MTGEFVMSSLFIKQMRASMFEKLKLLLKTLDFSRQLVYNTANGYLARTLRKSAVIWRRLRQSCGCTSMGYCFTREHTVNSSYGFEGPSLSMD
jgi:hypothetical protein